MDRDTKLRGKELLGGLPEGDIVKVEVLFYPNTDKCLFRITTQETIFILEEEETKKLWRELSKAFRPTKREADLLRARRKMSAKLVEREDDFLS